MPVPRMPAFAASWKRAEPEEFQLQRHNPKELIAVLLIIGGEIVQKAPRAANRQSYCT